MQLTPTVRETVGSVVTHESKDTQTEEGLEKGAMEKVKFKLDAVKAEVAQALTGIFQYMEQLKTINMSLEEVISRLYMKLDQAETREREAREKEREDRVRRSERDRRTVRDRSRGHEKSRIRH